MEQTGSSSNSNSHNMLRAGSTSSNNAAAGPSGNADTPGPTAAAAASGRYWIKATVTEPVKMLEGTKDAYVAYNVKGEVRNHFI